jgi:PIN domain nuclease of toxin-antitoxin system
VSGYLLDTNAVLYTLMNDSRLSPRARNAIASGPNFISVASYWEVVIKSAKGKLDVGDPRIWWAQALKQLVATPLHIRPDHIEHVPGLPPIHKDPFDHVLIAQATAESLTLVTTDSQIPLYASQSFQVVI